MLPLRQNGIARWLFTIVIALECGGCGGGSSSNVQPVPQTPQADFSISFSASTVSFAQGASSTPVNLSVTGQNGFSGSVQITLATLPAGVSSNPASPFSVNAGAAVAVIFGAAANTAPGSFVISAQATSGSLSHSANLTLSIQQGTSASVARTSFVRTDATAEADNPSGEPHHRHVIYDTARKRLYVANRAMNRVEVFSTSTFSHIAQISVPGASSVDLSADGQTLWVGTVTNAAVAIDPQALQVVTRTAVPSLTPIPNTVFDRPEELIAMSSGGVYVRLRQAAQPEALLALWNPATNSLTNLTSIEPQLFQNGLGAMARSGDHTKLLVGAADSSGEIALFDASGNVVAGPRGLGAGTISYVASSGDASRFAVVLSAGGSSQLILLDSGLNTLATSPLASPAAIAFSLDGKTLHCSLIASSTIAAFDANNLSSLGQIPDISPQGVPSQIEAADETQMLFAISNRGIAFLDAAHPAALPSPAPVFSTPPNSTPSEGPNTGGTTIALAGQNFTQVQQVNVGSQVAMSVAENSATQITATSPPSVVSGPVNLTAYFMSGWLALAPDGFSYGPQILEVSPNGGSSSGDDSVQIYGYGFGTDATKVAVKIGGASATVQSIDSAVSIGSSLNLAAYPFAVERLTLTTPSGTPGNADITITVPSGSTTFARGFQFAQRMQFFPKAGLYKFILYDQHRNWLYLSNIDHVDVFDLAAQQFHSTPLQAPGGPPPSAGLRGLALTPDASLLAVADFGSQLLYLLNPDTGSGSTVQTGGVPGFAASGPARVAATSAQTIFVGLSGEGGSGGACSACLDQLDLTASPRSIAPAPQPEVTSIVGAPLLASSAGGNQVFVTFGTAPGGPLALWNSAAPNQFSTVLADSSVRDLGAATDGTMFASSTSAGTEIRNAALSLTSTPFSYELAQVPNRSTVPGIAVHPSGALIYQPFLSGPAGTAGTHGGIDILDAHSGLLRLRLFLPQQFLTDIDGLHGSFLAIDENGQRLFALTSSDGSAQNSGVTVVTLAAVPLGIGTVSPVSGPAAGGTIVSIRGSGFQSGATVTVGGKSAVTTFKDINTLTVTTPALSAGPQQIIISNPDGQTYTLDSAFTAH